MVSVSWCMWRLASTRYDCCISTSLRLSFFLPCCLYVDFSPSDGTWHTLEHPLEDFGTLGLCAKRKSASKDFVVTKRREVLELIKTQLEMIERFNSEYCSGNDSMKLTPNILGLNGTSLLYAAVEVMADLELIRKMISLGADPKKPRDKSPLELARKQYESCKGKERDACQSGKQIRQACAQKKSEVKRLLDALEAVT